MLQRYGIADESTVSKGFSLLQLIKVGTFVSTTGILVDANRGSILADVTLVLTPRKKSLGKHFAPEAIEGAYLLRLHAFELLFYGSVFYCRSS